jgi:hypothetical protein
MVRPRHVRYCGELLGHLLRLGSVSDPGLLLFSSLTFRIISVFLLSTSGQDAEV